MRPIDADALIKKYGDWYVEEGTESGFIGTLKNLLATEPTIQPQSTDLIDRQAAIDALDKRFDNIPMEQTAEILMLRKDLRELPTIQPEVLACGNGELVAQPEPHEGHWIRRDCGLDVECKCSRCGYRDFVEPRDEYWFKRNYCPNCGAKMKGERQK